MIVKTVLLIFYAIWSASLLIPPRSLSLAPLSNRGSKFALERDQPVYRCGSEEFTPIKPNSFHEQSHELALKLGVWVTCRLYYTLYIPVPKQKGKRSGMCPFFNGFDNFLLYSRGKFCYI